MRIFVSVTDMYNVYGFKNADLKISLMLRSNQR